MRAILDTLAHVVEETIVRFAKRHPGCRYALDCNADYGNVIVAVDSSPVHAPLDEFLSESAEELYWFGDWPISDLTMEDKSIEALWQKEWSEHESVIRDKWSELSDFEYAVRKKRLLQGICGIAADLSFRMPGIVSPILVWDHDEPIRHTAARMRWAFKGPPTPAHAILAHGYWLGKEEKNTHYLGFFHDHQFIDYVVLFGDTTCTVKGTGDWRLSADRLFMMMTDTNWDRARELMWKDTPYDLLALDRHTLSYREEDGTIWQYEKCFQ